MTTTTRTRSRRPGARAAAVLGVVAALGLAGCNGGSPIGAIQQPSGNATSSSTPTTDVPGGTSSSDIAGDPTTPDPSTPDPSTPSPDTSEPLPGYKRITSKEAMVSFEVPESYKPDADFDAADPDSSVSVSSEHRSRPMPQDEREVRARYVLSDDKNVTIKGSSLPGVGKVWRISLDGKASKKSGAKTFHFEVLVLSHSPSTTELVIVGSDLDDSARGQSVMSQIETSIKASTNDGFGPGSPSDAPTDPPSSDSSVDSRPDVA